MDCFYYMFVINLKEVFPNADITKNPEATGEDRLLTAENKWLIAHADAKIDGAFNGLQGENISVL